MDTKPWIRLFPHATHKGITLFAVSDENIPHNWNSSLCYTDILRKKSLLVAAPAPHRT